MNSRNTDDIYSETAHPQPEPQAVRFVDIHVYPMIDQDEQETRTIEATLDEISQSNQPPDEDEQPGQTQPISTRQPGHTLSPILVVLVGILCLALLGKTYMYLVPMLTPTTTITIIPVSRQIQATRTLQVVTGQIGANQIAGRPLAAITLSQTQTTPTTGTAHQDAQPAHGTITFYNAAPTPQTIAMGTIITGSNGIQIVTDQDAIIPAAVYPTFGQATVAAHTVLIGSTANSQAGVIYGPCCRLNISAVSSAFTGGQDGRDYRTVSNQDITTTSDSLKASLTHSAYAALQTQVHTEETMLNPVCTNTVTSDHTPGDEATQVSVSVEQSCTTIAYQTALVQDLMSQATIGQAQKQLGTGYTRMGDITVTITRQSQDTTGASITVQGQGTWYASWNETSLSVLTGKIAGKGRQEATRLLLHTRGIAQIEGIPDTLPTDPAHIRVLVLYVSEKGTGQV